jgi:hypothetical protein
MLHDTLINIADLTLGTTPASSGVELGFLAGGILLGLLTVWVTVKLMDGWHSLHATGMTLGEMLGLALGLMISLLTVSIPANHNQRFSQCNHQTVDYQDQPATETWCSTRTDLNADWSKPTLTALKLKLDNPDGH